MIERAGCSGECNTTVIYVDILQLHLMYLSILTAFTWTWISRLWAVSWFWSHSGYGVYMHTEKNLVIHISVFMINTNILVSDYCILFVHASAMFMICNDDVYDLLCSLLWYVTWLRPCLCRSSEAVRNRGKACTVHATVFCFLLELKTRS